MKIRAVSYNNRKRAFEVKTARQTLSYPYARLDPRPTSKDRIVRAFVDRELAREGFTYELEAGNEGSVHIDQVLEYNQDPTHLRELLLYQLTIEAQKRIADSPLSRREVCRRLGTSASQLYRLLDQTNDRKSVDQMLSLLHVLDCDIDVVVRAKSA